MDKLKRDDERESYCVDASVAQLEEQGRHEPPWRNGIAHGFYPSSWGFESLWRHRGSCGRVEHP